MKKIIYALRTELSDKAGFMINIVSTALVLFFVMLFFGSYFGMLKNTQTVEQYSIALPSPQLTLGDIEEIKNLKGFKYCRISCEEYCYAEPHVTVRCFINSPGELFKPSGIPIENNENPNYIYVPYEEIDRLGDIGDEFVLGINKEKSEVKVFKRKKPEEGFELFKLTIDGSFGIAIGSTVCVSPSFFFDNLTPSYITIYLDAIDLTEDEYNDDLRIITEMIGEPELITDFDFYYGQILEMRRIEAAGLFVFGMISLLFLYSYTLSRKIRRFSVIKMCGATKGSVFAIIAAGCLFTFILSFLLAAILGKLLNLIAFEPVFGFNAFDLGAMDYLKLFTSTLIIYSLVSLIYIFRFIKNSAINVYRRSE